MFSLTLSQVIANHGRGPVLIEAPIVNRLSFLPNAKVIPPDLANLARQYRSSDLSDLELAHQRLGHIHFRDVARLTEMKMPNKTPFCEACVQGKSTRHPIGARSSDLPPVHDAACRPGYLIHSDHMGPFRVSTRTGKKYALLFIDDYSRRIFLYLLPSTNEVLPSFEQLIALIEAEFGRERVIAQFQSDCDPSCFDTHAFKQLLRQKGIFLVYSPPCTQALTGVAY